jgi:hypothetical protein
MSSLAELLSDTAYGYHSVAPFVQITLGREYSRQEVLALSEHYKQWTSGFLAWPW